MCGTTLKSWWDFSKVEIKFQKRGNFGCVSKRLLPEWHLSKVWSWWLGRQFATAEATLSPPLLPQSIQVLLFAGRALGPVVGERLKLPRLQRWRWPGLKWESPVERDSTSGGGRNPRGGSRGPRTQGRTQESRGRRAASRTYDTPAFPTTTVHATRRRRNQVIGARSSESWPEEITLDDLATNIVQTIKFGGQMLENSVKKVSWRGLLAVVH